MTPNDDINDRVLAALAALPTHDVDPARAASIRARCRAALAGEASYRAGARAGRGGSREERVAVPGPLWPRFLEPVLVAGLSVVFLVEVISRALRLEGF